MNRLVAFSDRNRLTLELAYHPPYHSKSNRIERCWGILENHWNGALLSTVATTLEWAKSMTWRGIRPHIHLMDKRFETGVRLTKSAIRPVATRLERKETLPKWSLVIHPAKVTSKNIFSQFDASANSHAPFRATYDELRHTYALPTGYLRVISRHLPSASRD